MSTAFAGFHIEGSDGPWKLEAGVGGWLDKGCGCGGACDCGGLGDCDCTRGDESCCGHSDGGSARESKRLSSTSFTRGRRGKVVPRSSGQPWGVWSNEECGSSSDTAIARWRRVGNSVWGASQRNGGLPPRVYDAGGCDEGCGEAIECLPAICKSTQERGWAPGKRSDAIGGVIVIEEYGTLWDSNCAVGKTCPHDSLGGPNLACIPTKCGQNGGYWTWKHRDGINEACNEGCSRCMPCDWSQPVRRHCPEECNILADAATDCCMRWDPDISGGDAQNGHDVMWRACGEKYRAAVDCIARHKVPFPYAYDCLPGCRRRPNPLEDTGNGCFGERCSTTECKECCADIATAATIACPMMCAAAGPAYGQCLGLCMTTVGAFLTACTASCWACPRT